MSTIAESAALKAAGNISGKYKVPANYILRSIAVAGLNEPVFKTIAQKLGGSSYVYSFHDHNDVLRYVGKGSGCRIFSHFSDADSAIYTEAKNLTPKILSAGVLSSEAFEIERHLIEDNRASLLNRRSGIVPAKDNNLRRRIAAAVVICINHLKELPWDTKRKTGDAVAIIAILCIAYRAGKLNGLALSERDVATGIGRSRRAASNALNSLCLLGFIKLSTKGSCLQASRYDVNINLLVTEWPTYGTSYATHTLSYSPKGDHVPHEAPSSPPLNAADGDTPSGEGNAVTEPSPHGIADDIKWMERLLASDAFRHGGLNKGALLIFLYMANFQDAAFSPRELVDRLGFRRSSMYRWIAKLRSVGYIVAVEKGKYRAIMPSVESLDEAAKRLGTAGRGLRYRERFEIDRAVYLSRILTGRMGNGFEILGEWILKEYRRILAEMRMIAQSMRRVFKMPRFKALPTAWSMQAFVPMRC